MNIESVVLETEKKIASELKQIDNTCYINSQKVLKAFQQNKLSESHFNTTTGYGYDDIGRNVIESIYKDIFHTEDALVRNQFISGSHALNVTLFALLRPNDTLLSITGTPYDTLHEVIGIKDNPSSLKSFNINYQQIDLLNNDFDYEQIEKTLNNQKIKVISIQRSKGYSNRPSISIDKLKKVIDFIKNINQNIIIMVDNCYCEFVSTQEPSDVGADIVVGSLIKNLGGGIAPNGAYVVGKKNLIKLVAERLTLPGEGKEVGPSLGVNKQILQGLFLSPSVVSSALKTTTLASAVLDKLGFEVEPKYNSEKVDIVLSIKFHDPQKLIKFVQGIQLSSPVDSYALPEPWDMPGYDNQVIMAAGCFTQGSSIELSCDGPIREPYIAYLQGSLTYEYGKIAIIKSLEYLING